jgi:zinc transporter 2
VNIRATFIHILGDILQSIGVIIAAIIIISFPSMTRVDPVCTFVFSVIVIFTTVPITRDCVRILMEGTPKEFKAENFTMKVRSIKGVTSVKNLHVWSVSQGKNLMTCHIGYTG